MSDQSQDTVHKEKGPAPILRAVTKTDAGYEDVMVLWQKHRREDNVPFITGFVVQDGKKVDVTGNFVAAGKSEKTGKEYGAFVSLRGEGFEATGQAINKVKEGECHFDTVVFNVKGSDAAIFARTTNAVDGELHDRLGFTADRTPREKRTSAPRP